MKKSEHKGPPRLRPIHLLLIAPFIAMLWTDFYNRAEPALAGIPFFYWFQLLWILLGAALLFPVFRAEEKSGEGDQK